MIIQLSVTCLVFGFGLVGLFGARIIICLELGVFKALGWEFFVAFVQVQVWVFGMLAVL
jgi:hypothetical protein